MKQRFILIMAFLISIMLLAGCSNKDLELERNQLKSEIETLQAEVDTLQKVRDGLIKKEDIIYVIKLEIYQTHFTLDLEEHLKDSMNKIIIPFEVKDGTDATKDILNFVFNVQECNDYNDLVEDTSLQKLLKKQLLKNKEIKIGLGKLKYN